MKRITLKPGIILFIFHDLVPGMVTLTKLAEENGEIIFNDSAIYFATRSEEFYKTIANTEEGFPDMFRDYRNEFDEVDTAKESIATALIYMNVRNPKTHIVITRNK